MNIANLCERDIVTVPASASIREAASIMRDQHVGALAVTDPYKPDHVIGIVTDRDLVLQVLATGRTGEGQAVGDVCRTDLSGVPATASIHEAVQAMQRAGVRRLLVMGKDKEVMGLVSIDDLLDAVAGELDALAGTLRTGIVREASRARARARAESESPRTLYLARNEP
jgi:CBS domain-containing protein